MINMVEITKKHSAEFDVDVSIDDLIGKIVAGTSTPADRSKLEELIAQRTRLMRRNAPNISAYRRRYA